MYVAYKLGMGVETICSEEYSLSLLRCATLFFIFRFAPVSMFSCAAWLVLARGVLRKVAARGPEKSPLHPRATK